jgi:hypothetical protein
MAHKTKVLTLEVLTPEMLTPEILTPEVLTPEDEYFSPIHNPDHSYFVFQSL